MDFNFRRTLMIKYNFYKKKKKKRLLLDRIMFVGLLTLQP